MRKSRWFSPWGYQEEMSYQSETEYFINSFDKMFSSVSYDKNQNKIIFKNTEGEEKGSLDVSEFVTSGSGSSIKDVTYADGKITIECSDGKSFTVDISGLVADIGDEVDELSEASFTAALYEDDPPGTWSINYYNIDGTKKSSVKIFDTDSNGNILMSAGQF